MIVEAPSEANRDSRDCIGVELSPLANKPIDSAKSKLLILKDLKYGVVPPSKLR
jgi:hypothetical protein